MSRVVDLDAIKAEAEPAEPLEVHTGDHSLLVHPAMPFEAAVAWNNERIDDAVGLLVVDADDAPTLRAALFDGHPSWREATRRLNAIYAQDPGESPAS